MIGADELTGVVRRRLLDEPAAMRSDDPVSVRHRVREILCDVAPIMSGEQAEELLESVVRDVVGLGPLEALLADPRVSEIMLNGPGRAYVERDGRVVPVDLQLGADAIEQLVQRVVAPLGLRLDRASPMADARLRDGSRLHAVLPPLAPDGPVVTIRRFATRAIALADFGATGAAEAWLQLAMAARWNMLIAGATSAGKTTLLNALTAYFERDARVVTIEDTLELRIQQPHVVRLEARPSNSEGVGAVGVRELVRAALRMRPDRIVVGEVRGGEALDMLQALNTGHDGSLCTVHANGTADALSRLETLTLFATAGLPLAAIRKQIASAIDAVVFVARSGDGDRRIEAISEVTDTRDELTVRDLFLRYGADLVQVACATRPARLGTVAP